MTAFGAKRASAHDRFGPKRTFPLVPPSLRKGRNPSEIVPPLPATAFSVPMDSTLGCGGRVSDEHEGAEARPSATPDTGGLALDLAMEEARNDPSLRGHVAAFLEDQRALIADQRHHMREQFGPQLRQLRLGVWEKRMGVFLRLATGFIGFVVAAGLAYLIWNAAHSNQMVIDAFAVPPQLAARGLSGPVVAAKLSDRIASMQGQITSQRAPKSYANGISDGLKLEIPETGVSLSELDRFLREKLGHDLHIGGEMVQRAEGITITVRAGESGSASVTGTEGEIDNLMQSLAEQVYRLTQPYRYAIWLQARGRTTEGIAILKPLAASGPVTERAWAYNGWGVAVTQGESERAGMTLLQRGHALDPNHYLLTANIAMHDLYRGRAEAGLRGLQSALLQLAAHGADYTLPERMESAAQGYRSIVFAARGSLLEAAEQSRLFMSWNTVNAPNSLAHAEILAALHEPTAASAYLGDRLTDFTNVANLGPWVMRNLRARMPVALEKENWPAVLAVERDFTSMVTKFPGLGEIKTTYFDPSAALALAHMGQFVAAEARLKNMPSDCYECLRARARIAALQGQHARADWWFARAVTLGPSIPYANAEWGKASLNRGQPDAAIEKFKFANKIGPHFADPLEGWGEALMAKNQSHRALAKFKQAEKYAPNWGRLHLKWGEALTYAGKREEARAQFARARQLDLTPFEKSELARLTHG